MISHERDLLNNVVDHILHLERGKTMLYAGGYDAFERQRAERAGAAIAAREQAAGPAREAAGLRRPQLGPRLDRQAGAVARQGAGPDAADRGELIDDPSLTFDFPDPDELRPPLITLDMRERRLWRSKPILTRLNLRLDPDDRIALLGRNGNGKTTLARAARRAAHADGRRHEHRGQDATSAISPSIRSKSSTATIRRSST